MSISPEQCSVHTHSDLCDGRDPLEAMAAAAFNAGVRYFGASGHSHTPIPHDAGNVLPEDLTDYRTRLERLREQMDRFSDSMFSQAATTDEVNELLDAAEAVVTSL